MAKRKRKRIDIFYAYPSKPKSLEETLMSSISKVKESPLIRNADVRLRPWSDLANTGRQIVGQITDAIDRADIFACDLTYANFNVAFELGFAIGRFKRVWISLNTGIEGATKEYRRSYAGLIGVGYSGYQNGQELANAIMDEHPWTNLDDHLLGDIYRNPAPRAELPILLYMKPSLETDAVISTSEILRYSIFGSSLIVDDPKENPSPTLAWYADAIQKTDAVLIHILADDQVDALGHNVKCSFVAGLAYGLRKNILMVAHTPFACPLDYQHILRPHETAQQCSNIVQSWLSELEASIPRRRSRRPQQPSSLDIRSLSIGEFVAENEWLSLDDYFVETNAYNRAIDSQTSILVGRRGTGKTAISYAIQKELSSDKLNHVCVIKPVGYEIDALIRLLEENIHRAERGYLIESLWKFLIYSELACSVFNHIRARPAYQPTIGEEKKLLDYVERHAEILHVPFSQRLEKAVQSLLGVGSLTDTDQQRVKISESLHSHELRELREILGLVLSHNNRVAILIDNLDDPWLPGQHIEYLSDMILGLLRVGGDITSEFQHQHGWRKRAKVSVTILIRSDIFAYIHPRAAEQDKLPIQRIVWSDREVLWRLLDARLQSKAPTQFSADEIWEKVFTKDVVGLSPREFVTNTTLPRPRDAIYLVKEAIGNAVNRGHAVVSQDDFIEARKKYSEYVFRSILAEDDPRRGKRRSCLNLPDPLGG